MFGFLASEEPTPTLGRVEYWFLYGTGSKLIYLAVTIVDHVLTLVYYVVDARNGKEEEEDVHDSAPNSP